MKKILIFLFSITIYCNVFAQNEASSLEPIVISPTQRAICLSCGEGGDVGSFLDKEIKYPALSRKNEIQGKVYIKFIVEKDGSISNLTIMRLKSNKDEIIENIKNRKKNKERIPDDIKEVEAAEFALGEETKRVTLLLAKWKAAEVNGKAVRTSFVCPLTFKLQ